MKRIAYFISDGTGITAEMLGNSLLAQFETIQFERVTFPYVDSIDKAEDIVEQINSHPANQENPPIIFDTVIKKDIRAIVDQASGLKIDIFSAFLAPLEKALGVDSSYTVGKSHSAQNTQYASRINAVNYALANDDGGRTRQYEDADIILIGVSRCGKTPTSLYLAMQFGIKAANYPLTEDDISEQGIPRILQPFKKKLYGLTIDPDRLSLIRNERRANSQYASIKQCHFEVDEVEAMYRRERIPYVATTDKSIEEISTRIMAETGLHRRFQS